MTTQIEITEVAVVGGGPTGLVLAVRLAQLGVPHVVVDSADGPTRESRATLVHAATLEILDELGVADELIAAGVQINRIGFSDRGHIIARIGLAGVPTRYPYALGVPQSTTEGVLTARLAALGGSIRRGHQAEKVAPAPEGYLVTGTGSAEAGAAPFEISARYVIGCDGAHSIVRSSAGLDFPGGTYPSQFVLADAQLRAAPGPDDEARIFTSPHGVTVTGRLPSGNHRIVATVDAGLAVPDPPGRAFIDEILRERGVGQLAADPVWSSRFRVHHRVADRFRAGDVFLCGDAAHVHSPAAGWMRVPLIWYAVVLLLIPALWLAAAGIPALLGLATITFALSGVTVLSGLGAGLLEELGWRGFALPRMQARRPAFTASLLLGVLWTSWHLPLTIAMGLPLTAAGLTGFLFSLLMLTAWAVLFTWVYNNTSGSLFLMVLLHAVAYITGATIQPSNWTGSALLLILAWATVTLIVAREGTARLSRSSDAASGSTQSHHRLRRPLRGTSPPARVS